MNSINSLGALATSICLLALVIAFIKYFVIASKKVDHARAGEISNYIREGSMAFLKREYQVLGLVVLVLALVLYFVSEGPLKFVSVSFVIGALFSCFAGYLGMKVATLANVRTALAARESLNRALKIAFSGGSVMGLGVVGLGLLGILLVFLGVNYMFGSDLSTLEKITLPSINGFIFGSAIVALFARVGGGIYTKAADVGADLVGKVESGIPEDDPRNPAVIADNVGDNVGDTAGMGSDIFQSYVASIASVMILGLASHSVELVLLPLVVALTGIVITILSGFFIQTKENGNPQVALNVVTLGASFAAIVCLYFVVDRFVINPYFTLGGATFKKINLYFVLVLGLLSGIAIGLITEYYTKMGGKPVKEIASSSQTGGATNILSGLSLGMRSTALPVIVVCLLVASAYFLAGIYGIALASLGMLATIGVQLAVDAYGPIADNAGGIAEMAELGEEVRERTDKLDAVGNTTAAVGKGFAIGSAALTSISLFSAFEASAGIYDISLSNPFVILGMFLGATLPFLFSSMAIAAVSKAAYKIIEEVRRQFKEIPGLMEGKANPDYKKCVDISTKASIKEMMAPGLVSLLLPVFIGFFFGKQMLGGFLIGVTLSGILLAIFMANAGGAWDNAKKYIEQGHLGGKGSPSHKAAVMGDTVGDPFKDTSGPSMNILVKLVVIVSLVMAPYL